jgi:3'-phosphoadenosine 5'-phosphosulfate sulfotransferase (PAPS reductase)/FAD synthetase
VPLRKSFKGNAIWITGLRAEQSENRNDLALFEYDSNFEIIKFNPLLKWTLQEVEDYLEKIMYHKHYTKKDCKHRLCTLYKTITQMKTSELDDGGGNQS